MIASFFAEAVLIPERSSNRTGIGTTNRSLAKQSRRVRRQPVDQEQRQYSAEHHRYSRVRFDEHPIVQHTSHTSQGAVAVPKIIFFGTSFPTVASAS